MAYLDALEGRGYEGKRSSDYRHYDSRPRAEKVLYTICPVCDAGIGQWCDRSKDWHPCSPYDLALQAAGTPRSHLRRYYLAQNGTDERESGRNTTVKTMAKVPQLSPDSAPCPRCHAARGSACAGRTHRERLELVAARYRRKQNWRMKRAKDRARAAA
jgi:hypothetical protein